MPLTQVIEPPANEFASCELGRRLATVERPSRLSSERQSKSAAHRSSGASASRKPACPTMHHFGLKTSNLDTMVDWYIKVLGMELNHRASAMSASAPRFPVDDCVAHQRRRQSAHFHHGAAAPRGR